MPPYPPVAVIGLACRFPGAPDAARFWQNLREGVASIRTLDADALRARGVPEALLRDPGYVRAAAELDDVDKFDAAYFGMSPREASVMDPAHRFFLEVAHHALEHAGHGSSGEAAVGVFASSGAPTYLLENLRENADLMHSLGAFLVRHTGNDMNFLATRASYALDLRGPSLNVQTACSSSLVAVHLACQSLARGECALALAGGSTIVLPMGHGYQHVEGEVLSPDGSCRPFDADAAGTVFGSGTGCVVLKLLSRALDDGDTIHAVIRGSAVNNDGAVKVGYLAPGVDGHAGAVRAALRAGEIDPRGISYVEAHGTGTRMGDPIEVAALSQALGGEGSARCGLGSVKSNIGHLGEAAGIASLIKMVLALSHRELPRTLGFVRANPELALSDTPFYVQRDHAAWTGPLPLRCGVSALGVGGTNCHVILEQPPEPLPGQGARPLQLLMLAAKDPAALARLASAHAAHLASAPADSLADAAYTLAVGRRAHAVRRVLVARDAADAAAQLRAQRGVSAQADEHPPRVVFMFPGAGPQYRGMGARLYATEPVYREAIDACIALAEAELGAGALRTLLTEPTSLDRAPLSRPTLALPALFAVEYALARLYLAWGVTPGALIGHSMGEYVAACVAEVMTLAEALGLVLLRARLSESVGGAMLGVALGEADARALGGGVDVAAVNAPSACVLSGPVAAIDAVEARLVARGVDCARLPIGLAAHSACLDPVLSAFREACRRIALRAPTLPIVSSLTGRVLAPDEARDPEYWVRHFRGTVQFARGIAHLLDESAAFLELGPGRGLATLVRAQGPRAQHVISTVAHAHEAADDLAHALLAYGKLWIAGAALDVEALYDGQLRNRVPLPGYPFARTRHWVEPPAVSRASPPAASARARPLDAWFEQVVYREAPRVSTARAPRRWLLFVDDARTGKRLARALPGDAFVITPGTWLQRIGPRRFALEVPRSACYDELMRALVAERFVPEHVVYAFGAGRAGALRRGAAPTLERALFGLTFLARALGRLSEPVQLSVLTHGVAEVDGGKLRPLAATSLGPVLTTPREYASVRTRLIDLPGPLGARRQLAALADELNAEDAEQVVALRPRGRWARAIVPASLPEPARPRAWLRPDSVVVVTGGLGGIALEICLHMARERSLKLALIGRGAGLEDGRARADCPRARKLAQLRALGAELLVLSADVAERASLARALTAVRARFGAIDGVLHAAGVLDDELMETRALPAMQRVLAPKVEGTLLLDQLITEPLAFFVVFSSVASLLGLPGQVDYTAANAFLDAFARARAARAPGLTRVIDWSAWREVGMTAEALLRERAGAASTHAAPHPALDGWSRAASGGSVFTTSFRGASHWLLAEHRVRDAAPLLSGTALIELTRAAAEQAGLSGPLEMANVQFLSPFQVAPDGARTLAIALTPLGAGFEAVLFTQDEPREAPHATADVRRLIGAPPRPLDLSSLRARCNRFVEEPRDGLLQQGPVELGPRWASLRRVAYGSGEALIALQLPARFSDDLTDYRLHPALLDMATGGAQRLIPGRDAVRDFHVPVGYGSLRMHAPLTDRVFSHVRVRPSLDPSLAHFDVTLAAPDGRVLVEITRFTMKRLDPGARLTRPPARTDARAARVSSALEAVIAEAIAPADGVLAFERIMAQSGLTQVIASSVDLAAWQARLEPPRVARVQHPTAPPPSSDEPALESAIERQLAALWAELLGVARVRGDADFFELGGSSLLAVRLFARVNRQFGVTLPLSTLFAAPTVRALARVLEEAAQPALTARVEARERGARAGRAEGFTSLVPMQPKGARPPFYCAAGMHGNPLNLRLLAAQLGSGQPFFGLQPQGLDGKRPLHRTVPEMAAHYVRELRRHQPRGPYYLGGYSGGGIIAFEMARQLVAARAEVGALVLLDAPAPSLPTRPPLDRLKLHLSRLGEHGPGYPGRVLAHHLGARLDGAKLRAQRIAGRFAPELRFRYLLDEVADAWLEAARAYRPEGYAGRGLLLRAEDDGGELSGTATVRDAQNGWGAYVFGGLEVRAVPGDHATMCEEPNVRVLARHLAAYLERCVGERAALRASRADSSAAAP